MKKIYKPALEAVINEEIKFYPAKFKNLYRNWMENIRDWCISRQLWWGHRIPAWYDEEGNVYVAKTEEEARLQAASRKLQDSKKIIQAEVLQREANSLRLHQDEDVLDTWFSSWLWPFEVFQGYSDPGNADVKYYYPTNTLVTAPEIIFFWVARMIMAGFEYMKDTFPNEPEKWKPFGDVYFTGIVRDELGRKMSKQLGNSPDLLGLIDKYGADAVRFGIMISSPAGNDLLFDVKEESTLKQGSFFINKMWNASKLVKMWEGRQAVSDKPQAASFAVEWFENRLNQVKAEIEGSYKDFRLSEILKTIYSLIWDDFCSWYLEWAKPGFEESIDTNVYNKTVEFFEELMQLLHPFMPFVTEEIYHRLKERNDDITVKQLSRIKQANQEILQIGSRLKNDITALREARKKFEIKNSEKIEFTVNSSASVFYGKYVGSFLLLQKQTNTIFNESRLMNAQSEGDLLNIVKNELHVVSSDFTFFLYTHREIDTSSQKEQLQKDLNYFEGFLASVEKKLGNERFVQNAKPEVVEVERRKKADAEAKIKAIKESLESLN
jgi:valyl-tRNA synthetase